MIPGESPFEQREVILAQRDAGILLRSAAGYADEVELARGARLHFRALLRVEE